VYYFRAHNSFYQNLQKVRAKEYVEIDVKARANSVSEAAFDDDFEPLKNVRQSIKVLARTIYCSKCLAADPSSKETSSFYCPCGSFLCTYHIIGHKCLVTSSMEYDKELLASLT
jgi:succinate dehydrogenase/fumarate reductase-like Fe-S protein